MENVKDIYTHGHDDAVLRSHRWRTVQNSAEYLMPYLSKNARVLDVGCGPGTLTVDMARTVSSGDVIGVDVAESVVKEAKDYARTSGVANVSFLTGDFREQSGLGSFDVVHAHQVVQHLRDPIGALSAMAKLVRPGGIIAVRESDYGAFSWFPFVPALHEWRQIYSAVARRNGAEPDAGRHLLSWARSAGLSEVTYSSSTWTFATPLDREWWADLWAERCTSTTFAHQAQDYGVATKADLLRIAEGWHDWAHAPDAIFIVVHGEFISRCG